MWATAAPTVPAAAAPARRPRIDWRAIPPRVLASAAISAAVIVLFLANLFIALGEVQGTPGNVRLLQFLSPADVAVGGLLLLAVALVAVGPSAHKVAAGLGVKPFDQATAGSKLTDQVRSGSKPFDPEDVRMAAGFVAVAVGAAALVRAIVALTIAHERGAFKFGNMLDALAALVVAAVAAYWALVSK